MGFYGGFGGNGGFGCGDHGGVWGLVRLIDGLIVWGGEDGGEGGGGGEGAEGGVELGGGDGDEGFEGGEGGAGGGDGGGFGGEGAGLAGLLEPGADGDALHVGEEAGDIEVLDVDQGWLGEGEALFDGGDVGAAVLGEEGHAHEGGGVALRHPAFAGEEAAGEGDGVGGGGQQIAEAGAAAVAEGVEVALGRAGAGAATAATPARGNRERCGGVVGREVSHGGCSMPECVRASMAHSCSTGRARMSLVSRGGRPVMSC